MWVRTTSVHYESIHDATFASLWIDACVHHTIYLWIYACIWRGSNCERLQWHRHMWGCTQWVYIQKYLWSEKMYTCEYLCTQTGSSCERSQGHRHMRVSAPWVLVQKCPLHKKNMNICGYMHVYIEVRSVRASHTKRVGDNKTILQLKTFTEVLLTGLSY